MQDVLVGRIKFLLVRIKLKHMEVEIRRCVYVLGLFFLHRFLDHIHASTIVYVHMLSLKLDYTLQIITYLPLSLYVYLPSTIADKQR